MKKSRVVTLVVLLFVLTGISVAVHFATRTKVADKTIQLTYKDAAYTVEYEELSLEQVSGTRVNGKGEEKKVEAPGILLKEILDEKGIQEYSQVRVVSDDSYSAQVEMKEIQEEGKVYLLFQEEEFRLVVFGDENSKRSVSNVKQIFVD